MFGSNFGVPTSWFHVYNPLIYEIPKRDFECSLERWMELAYSEVQPSWGRNTGNGVDVVD